ncbi:MAG TPA: hypothetical protein VLI05_02245 [Candidatus Saccharimonadia bacterium]|nr:hypothetical protein [Candidatus Saccharimonadia bacterium]
MSSLVHGQSQITPGRHERPRKQTKVPMRRQPGRAAARRQQPELRTRSNDLVAAQLNELRDALADRLPASELSLSWDYEPTTFTTGRDGHGLGHFRPDFRIRVEYLGAVGCPQLFRHQGLEQLHPSFEFHLEVTEGDKRTYRDKRLKAAGVKREHGVHVVVLGRGRVGRLMTGQATLLSYFPHDLAATIRSVLSEAPASPLYRSAA